MVKKDCEVSLDEDYVQAFKETGLSLNKFCNDCLENYMNFIDKDYDSIMANLKRIDEDINELKMSRTLMLKQILFDDMVNDDSVKNTKVYESYVENKGIYSSNDYDELVKVTGLRKSQLQRLTKYFQNYDGDDYSLFKDVDYAIAKFNDEHPNEIPLCRDISCL